MNKLKIAKKYNFGDQKPKFNFDFPMINNFILIIILAFFFFLSPIGVRMHQSLESQNGMQFLISIILIFVLSFLIRFLLNKYIYGNLDRPWEKSIMILKGHYTTRLNHIRNILKMEEFHFENFKKIDSIQDIKEYLFSVNDSACVDLNDSEIKLYFTKEYFQQEREGYEKEIKSMKDTLRKLIKEIDNYNAMVEEMKFDYLKITKPKEAYIGI